MKPDRFDLEQAIMDCWQVCDDIKENIDPNVLSQYYHAKFDKLWNIFEELTHDKYFDSNPTKTQKSTNKSSS